jgi:Holliday junction DNA helicase RuvB
MDHPGNEINDVAPTSLSHIVGQKSVVEQVRVAIEAAFADQRKFDHALLVGPPGLGKTTVARIIAEEMATPFHEVLGQSIANIADLNAVLLSAADKSVVFVDEAHELDPTFQTALYLALDQRKVILQGARAGRGPQSIPVSDFSLLLATTDEFRLLAPMRDRCRLLLRFEFNSPEELTVLLRQHSQALKWRVEEAVFPLIAGRARGTPRLALRLLQSCRRVCRSEGRSTITLADLERACQLEQVDALGLGPTEQQYLEAVAGGASRLNVIASMLGLPARTVAQVVEPFLLRAGLLIKDDAGRRQLTVKGREHLSSLRSGG